RDGRLLAGAGGERPADGAVRGPPLPDPGRLGGASPIGLSGAGVGGAARTGPAAVRDVPGRRQTVTGARDLARRAAFEAKTLDARYPALAIPIARRRHGIPFGPRTDVVIEGFPRTGTSFAVAAFAMAQPRPLEVACHVHAPAQVIAAVRAGVPSLVIVREPEDTVLSYAIRNPHIPLAQAIRGYVRFYGPLVPLRRGFVTATF